MPIEVVPEPNSIGPASIGPRACLSITWSEIPDSWGVDSTETILATFNGELADRHPPTAIVNPDDAFQRGRVREGVRLLTWGDPYLEAWLEAIQQHDRS